MIVDMDQHYYETDDCCTRHVLSRYRDRVPRPKPTSSGEREWRIGDRHLGFERWVRDITIGPGTMRDAIAAALDGRPYQPELVATDDPRFRSRSSRLALLDEWGIHGALMLPTAGLAWDAEMTDDPEAASAAASAFNRWLEDEWGYAYEGRLFAAPFISLLDLDAGVAELTRVLDAGARMVLIRTGPVAGRSPGHPSFDPFWAVVNEAGVPVGLHISTSGYEMALSQMWGEDPRASHRNFSAFQWYVAFATRPIVDTLAALVFSNLFGRFPNLRVVSIENGSRWVGPLLHDLDVAFGFVAGEQSQAPWPGGRLREPPSTILRRHLYVAPFLSPGFDAPVDELVRLLGADHVVFGSDWPHGEGRRTPLDYLDDLPGLVGTDRRRFLQDNGTGLLGLRLPEAGDVTV